MRYALLINTDKKEPISLLTREADLHLSVLTKPKYVPLYKDFAEVWTVSDVANLMEAQAAVLQMLRRHPLDIIIAPYERSLLTGGFLRSYFGIPGLTFDQTLRFAHKIVMKRHLQQASFPVAPFETLSSLEEIPLLGDLPGWPIVVKPAVGSGAVNTFYIETVEQFHMLRTSGQLLKLEQPDVPLLVERFVPMDAEYHCDGLIHQGRVVFASVSRYFRPLLSTLGDICGSYVLEESDAALEPIQELHQQIINVSGLESGVTHLQVFGTASGFIVGEITCRPAGGGIIEAIQYQFNVNLWEAFIRSALGKEPHLVPERMKGVVGRCGLPCRNGRIVYLTPTRQLLEIPGVIAVQMYRTSGEKVQEKQTSTFFSGLLYFRCDRTEDVPVLLDEVRKRFRIEVEVDA
jgi:hypothetical protein